MPFGDGTGPRGLGPRTGRRGGAGMGRGSGMGRGRSGAGPDGNCVCSKCGTIVPHQIGAPCYETACPKCGAPMIRE